MENTHSYNLAHKHTEKDKKNKRAERERVRNTNLQQTNDENEIKELEDGAIGNGSSSSS